MDFFANAAMAFQVALEPLNILFCFLGCLVGTFVGVLPGLGPAASISLLLPLTFLMPPEASIIMLGGLYYGTMYGGSTTSILLNIPGEAASVVTCLDGYQMAKKGRAGPALGIAAFGSFIAGTFGTFLIMVLAPPLAKLALKFGPPEFVGLVFLGLTLVTSLSGGSKSKALMMAVVGLLLSYVGIDIVTGRERFTFGISTISGGFDMVPIAMGLFGISEVLINLTQPEEKREIFNTSVRELLPSKQDWKDSAGPIGRGSIVGFLLGIIPGGGGMLSSFVSYAMEKKLAKHPENFGLGDIKGRGWPGIGEQRRSPGRFHPNADDGDPLQRYIGHTHGRPDDPWRNAWPAYACRAPSRFLGSHRKHVYRQYNVAFAQSASHWAVGQNAEGSLRVSVSVHFPVLPYRRLHYREQLERYPDNDHFRCRWILDEERGF